MLDFAVPVLYALLVWWLGTGIVLYVARLPTRTYPMSLTAGAALAMAAVAVIVMTNSTASTLGAYLPFTAAIVVWGFLELSLLTGTIVGPDRNAASPAAAGWGRVSHAVTAIIHHELALVAGGLVILAATYGAPNRTALWTYIILWLMRLIAKLNLFLGVPNLHDELLPERLHHLRSHFRRGPANPLLPVAIILPLFAAGCLAAAASPGTAGSFTITANMLMATLLALAALEHVFMLLPLPVMNLWNWRRQPVHPPGPAPARAPVKPASGRENPEVGTSITGRGL
jgi:putative photosynthetic complex assembly protein 2